MGEGEIRHFTKMIKKILLRDHCFHYATRCHLPVTDLGVAASNLEPVIHAVDPGFAA